ncbi:MAG TPA: helix-turn-helix domain-containing protein [Pseudonocardia sp.]|nr:helix-turn-helix domain-containing protein [Pseudonocardia sp.]
MTPLPGAPLSRVLCEVGSTLLAVATGPACDPVVAGVAIHDPADARGEDPHRRGELVLGVGVADAERANALLAVLGRAGAAALVLRAPVPAYLESFGDMVSAARRLHVHPNTLRYRLRRIRELTGLDLDDADTRLAAALQLRAGDAGRDDPADEPADEPPDEPAEDGPDEE